MTCLSFEVTQHVLAVGRHFVGLGFISGGPGDRGQADLSSIGLLILQHEPILLAVLRLLIVGQQSAAGFRLFDLTRLDGRRGAFVDEGLASEKLATILR